MRILIAAVGRAKRGPARDLYEHYARRLRWPLILKEIDERRPLPPQSLKERKAERLLAAVPAGACLVVVDEGGATLTSTEFAAKMRSWQEAGVADLVFAIGDAEGHAEILRRRADFVLSLGAMTWPHLLVRGLLAEQLYRAQQILAGHPYHRD
ncbi:MAG: 23S rRNA (pseudouridine(1915)-N(3))-methyltransferase RlmH [Alphaproteobacteria bacterium]